MPLPALPTTRRTNQAFSNISDGVGRRGAIPAIKNQYTTSSTHGYKRRVKPISSYGSRFRKAPDRALCALCHRDVGAFQFLFDAGALYTLYARWERRLQLDTSASH